MENVQRALFFERLYDNKAHFPFTGQIELTYRCNLDCIHCYCKGLEQRELTTEEWKKILNILQEEGCVSLCFTGGDPLIRKDFLEIYSYAKAKGFIITIFTNGRALTPKLVNYFVNYSPFSIEITLNGVTGETYESITKTPGSFPKVMRAINLLKEKKLPFIVKTNCLKQNKHEIGRIKSFTEGLFDNLPGNKFRFKYDPLIYPRQNRDKTPCDYRLSFKEIKEVIKEDPDIWKEYQQSLDCKFPRLRRKNNFLYLCDAWQHQFFINPYGWLKFCQMTDKFSIDLKTTGFKEGFYTIFPKLLHEKFKTKSKCEDCNLRRICHRCPAKAYLETGDEEAPVPYFCELAKGTYREMKRARNGIIV